MSFKSQPCKKSLLAVAAAVVSAFGANRALSTVYYVSPNGSDSNSGTNSSAAWGSVAKIDTSVFKPGDQILFQYGSSWDASLTATSSGSTTAPIVYGAYGNPSLGNPTFFGSNPISNSAFAPVTGTTYQTTYSTPVNWVYNSHQFMREAQDALGQAGSANANDPATDVNFVETTPGSFYYNSANAQLYVNSGASASSLSLTIGTRDNAIYDFSYSNLVFQNLNTSETALDQAGYGIRIENASNVRVLNSTVSLSGKHAVGALDVDNFTGTNIVADRSQLDQGYGGASAFVNYADANSVVVQGTNNTAVWNNISYTNPSGPYPIYISHGSPNGIASVAINNVTSLGGYGTGISVFTTSSSETTLINGANLAGSTSYIDSNNSVVNEVNLTGGYQQDASITLAGMNSVVQNSLLLNVQSDTGGGQPGAIIDSGYQNTIRFNTDYEGYQSPAIAVLNQSSGTKIYANVFQIEPTIQVPYTGGIGFYFFGSGSISSNYNLYGVPTLFFPSYGTITQASWQSLGYDASSLFATPLFSNVSGGDYSLAANSPGVGLYPLGLDSSLTLANSFVGNPSSNGKYSAGLNSYVPMNLSIVSAGVILNNGQTSVVNPAGNTLTIQPSGSIVLLNTSTLDLSGNISNSGTFVAAGTLIQTGNFNNSGNAVFAGPQLWSPATVFTNAAGYATFQTDAGGPIAPEQYLSFNVSGGLVTFTSTQHVVALTIGPAGRVQVANTGTGRSLIITNSVAVTGKLDLGGNDLLVLNGNLQAIDALVASGMNIGGLAWTGNGIASSNAAIDSTHATALAVIQNSIDGVTPLYGSGGSLGMFDGVSPGPADVLVRYTYYGDTNLDGVVDGSDYSRIDNGYLSHLTGWYNGDLNYDGVVNGSDYTLIDNAYNQQNGELSAAITSELAPVSVPEPVGICSFALFAAAMTFRPSFAGKRTRRTPHP